MPVTAAHVFDLLACATSPRSRGLDTSRGAGAFYQIAHVPPGLRA
jgi:hypothetical protein